MSNYYRLFAEPKYGDKAPEVEIPPAENIDINNPAVWRAKFHPESAAYILNLIRHNNVYDSIMTVPTTELYLKMRDGYMMHTRVYHPDGEGKHPVMLFIHGGAFMYNDLSIYDYVIRYLCKYSGAVIFAMEYRLAPENKCPIGREDCYEALEWVAEHAAEYGGDISSYTICGDSAGGALVASLALMARDRNGPKISKHMMIFPLTSFVLESRPYSELLYGNGGYFLSLDSTNNFLNNVYFNDPAEAKDPYNSPLLSDNLKDLPDAIFYSAECDPLLDQGLMYAAKLQDAGVNVEYHIYDGMIHGFINRAYQKTYECLNQICKDIPKLQD